MAAAESSAGRILKGEAAAAIQRAAGVVVVSTGSDAWGDQHISVRHRGHKEEKREKNRKEKQRRRRRRRIRSRIPSIFKTSRFDLLERIFLV